MLPFFILFTPEKLFNILIINIKSLKITNLPFNYFIDNCTIIDVYLIFKNWYILFYLLKINFIKFTIVKMFYLFWILSNY